MPIPSKNTGNGQTSDSESSYYKLPAAVELPKGGGAIRGIGEKFSVNPVTGTGALSVPIFATPSRSGFYPQLSLSYDSGAGNGVFGLGWNWKEIRLTVGTIAKRCNICRSKFSSCFT